MTKSTKHVDETPPGEKEVIQSSRNFKKLVKGKNVVNEGHEVNRKVYKRQSNRKLSAKEKLQNLGELMRVVKGKKLVYGNNEAIEKAMVQMGNKIFCEKHGIGNNGDKENYDECVAKSRPDKREVVETGSKSRKVVKIRNSVSGANDKEHFYQNSSPRNKSAKVNHFECVDQDRPVNKEAVKSQGKLKKVVKEENRISAQKIDSRTRGTEKKQLDHNAQVQSSGKDIQIKLLHENCCKNEENESDDDDGLEILDSAALFKEGNLNNFVSATSYRNMADEYSQSLDRSNMCSEYREKLLNILKKPYDREESKRLSEAVKAYYKAYPSFQKKMIKYRYKRGKHLNIMRGFFFWLQNVAVEEVFRPWKDRECLAVEPPSVD